MIQNYQDTITISNMFVLALTALVVFSLMHQIPSAYIVAQTVMNEAMRQSCILNRRASMLVLLHYGREGSSAVIFSQMGQIC